LDGFEGSFERVLTTVHASEGDVEAHIHVGRSRGNV
jgi:hypothetical protein